MSCTRLFFLVSLQLFAWLSNAQTDTSFWFAAPEIAMHGTYTLDRPIYLRLSAYSISANVVVSQPANTSFVPIIVNIAANTSAVVNLTAFIDMIENKPPNQINDYGIHISSTAPITAYYEILGGETTCNTCNPEFFSLKGKNALGTSFWIPMQKTYSNDLNYSPAPYSSFDIVATEDNTLVTILPTQNLVGHSANTSFSITLNKGQTYCASSASVTASLHPSGSRVTSNKPIAVTMKEDLLYISGYGSDIMGDQLIPESKIGTEYIVMKAPQSVNDQAVIVATQNNTQIFVNGVLQTTLNQAQSYQYSLNSSASGVAYINSTSPVYLFQLTTCVGETGGAILPPIGCNGSSNLSITRSTSQPYYIFLITRTGNEGNFLFNGLSGVIMPSSFLPVPGTSNTWMYAIIDLSGVAIVGNANYVSNTTGLFHLGLLQGLLGGSGYGWFSDFSSLGSNTSVEGCVGEVFTLNAIATSGASHIWYDGSQSATHTASQAGAYTVQSTFAGCVRNDTFTITTKPKLSINLGEDTAVCSGGSVLLGVPNSYTSYIWQNGATTHQLTAGTSGLYWLEVDSVGFCLGRDSINVNIVQFNVANVGYDTAICIGDIITLAAISTSGASHIWYDGSQSATHTVSQAGVYWVQSTFAGCESNDTFKVTNKSKLNINLGEDTVLCNSGSIVLGVPNSYTSYLWQNAATNHQIIATTSGLYWLEVDSVGFCSGSDSINVTILPFSYQSTYKDTTICAGGAVVLSSQVPGGTYVWHDGSTNPLYTAYSPGIYSVTASYSGSCEVVDSVMVSIINNLPTFSLGSDTTICGDFSKQLFAADGAVWNTGATANSITINAPGLYWAEAANGCGTFRDTLVIDSKYNDCNLAIPTAFSPNGDGKNDVFKAISYCQIKDYTMRVYNRWGELVYQTFDILEGWNGTYKQTPQPVGVFIYYVEYWNECTGQKEVHYGNTTLLR